MAKLTSLEVLRLILKGNKMRFTWWPDGYHVQRDTPYLKGFPEEFDEYVQENFWSVIELIISDRTSDSWEIYNEQV